MQLSTINQQTMSSREMADLCEKRHDSVKRTIETLAANGSISQPQIVDGPKAANGVVEKHYLMGKRDSYVVVAQLSPEFTARLVDRWQELEAAQGQQFNIPTTLSGALRLAAEQAEKIEEQAQLIEQQRPAVEFVGRYVEAKSTKAISDVAKILGAKQSDFFAFLSAKNIIFKRGNSWLPYSEHQHRFEVKTGEANGHAFVHARFTPDGIAWIAKKWSQRFDA